MAGTGVASPIGGSGVGAHDENIDDPHAS